jgi:hypothetical protein
MEFTWVLRFVICKLAAFDNGTWCLDFIWVLEFDA